MNHKVKLFVEIDFAKKAEEVCGNCGEPFAKHFQLAPDSDPRLARNWCPNVRTGRGFTSMEFKRSKTGGQVK